MQRKLTRDELVELVERILRDGSKVSEEQVDQWLELFERNVPHPEATGLIYWPQRYGLGREPRAEEIVDTALDYRPIAL